MALREITTPATTSTLMMASVTHNSGESVLIMLRAGSVNEDGIFVPSRSSGPPMVCCVDGDNYAELMSANPTWAPNKPAGTFREEDLWQYIAR